MMQDKICNVPMDDFNEMVSAAIKAETKKNAVDRIDGESHKRAAFNQGQGEGSSSK